MSADAAWSGRCASRGLGVLGCGVGLLVTAVGIVLVVLVPGAPALGSALVGLGVLVAFLAWWASRLQVVVDAGSLVVAWGPTGWPRKRIRWDRVRNVSAIQVEPTQWGGWGYRWIPWARASAAVVRRGPGIKLDLVDGRCRGVAVSRTGTVHEVAARPPLAGAGSLVPCPGSG